MKTQRAFNYLANKMNSLEQFWIDSGLLKDIMTNADPLDFGESKEWTSASIKVLCEQQVLHERKMAEDGDENSMDWIKTYDELVSKNLTEDYTKLLEAMDDEEETYVCYDCCRYTNQTRAEREQYDPLCKKCYEKREEEDEEDE